MCFILLPFLESDATHQMNLDMELFRIFSSQDSPPMIRFYKISPPAFTIGYHQSEESVLELLGNRSIDVVRRPTGGRAVLHLGDLTYSLVGGGPLFGRSTLEIYHSISKGVKRGLEKLGIRLDFLEGSKLSSSPLCFRLKSKYELSYKGEKMAGGALLKRNGVFLFQGSILVDGASQKYAEIYGSRLSLSEIAGERLGLERLIETLKEGIEESFGVEVRCGTWPNNCLDKKRLLF